jgi:hypothetical protein
MSLAKQIDQSDQETDRQTVPLAQPGEGCIELKLMSQVVQKVITVHRRGIRTPIDNRGRRCRPEGAPSAAGAGDARCRCYWIISPPSSRRPGNFLTQCDLASLSRIAPAPTFAMESRCRRPIGPTSAGCRTHGANIVLLMHLHSRIDYDRRGEDDSRPPRFGRVVFRSPLVRDGGSPEKEDRDLLRLCLIDGGHSSDAAWAEIGA